MVTAGSRSNVICRALVPSVRITHRFACPPLSERYTSSEPSGLTDGVCTCPVCLVTRVIARVFSTADPATGHFQMSDSLRMRHTTSRPDACTSGSTNDTSPDVICVSRRSIHAYDAQIECRRVRQRAALRGAVRRARPVGQPGDPAHERRARKRSTLTAARGNDPQHLVPIWAMPPPGSCALGRNSPRMRRCALDETGRNSVRPWTSPRMMASRRCIARLSVRAEKVGQHALAEHEGVERHALVDAVDIPVKSRSAGSRRGAKP